MNRMRLGLLAAGLVLASGAVVHAGQYQLSDLGAMGAPSNYMDPYIAGVNDCGQAAGGALAHGQHGYLFSGGQVQDLGGLNPLLSMGTVACGINDAGQVVGQSGGSPFLYGSGQMQALSPMPGTANAINNDGQIVGEVTYPVSPALFSPQAFLYAGGQMQYLPQGGSYSVAYAISADSNCIAGISTGSAGLADTFLYTGGQMHDLGMAPGGAVQPISVTDSGEVVGNTYASYGPTSSQAFVYRDGAFQSLAASGSTWTCACSANASGEIVGVSDAFIGTSNPAGVCFYANGSWTSLASLIDPQDGVTVAAAGAVNDAGQIAFIGDGPDGLEHAYLLSPTPEPATLSLLALGGLAAMKRRRA